MEAISSSFINSKQKQIGTRRNLMKRLMVLAMIAMFLPAPAFAANLVAGKRVAKRKCAGCHGETGAGNGPLLATLGAPKPPVSWTDKSGMARFTDQQITDVITKGGKAINESSLMPAFGNQLTPKQIENVAAYVRSLSK
jgi:mono/diheme cytochrome c family protein